jgi:5'-methylthioadenosine phosphorylase
MVTDYDAWRDEEEGVEAAEILEVMHANAATARNAVRALATILPSQRPPSPIDHALEHALVTAPAARDPKLLAKLEAVAGRVLR